MSTTNYSTLAEALAHIPDPRSARGRCYEWQFRLILISAALMSGKKSMLEINNWVQMHGEELKTTLKPKKGRIPSLATLQRVVRDVEITTLEATLSKFQRGLSHETGGVGTVVTQDGCELHGLALDGKTVRGASAYGKTVHLVSLLHHSSGLGSTKTRPARNCMNAAWPKRYWRTTTYRTQCSRWTPCILARSERNRFGKVVATTYFHCERFPQIPLRLMGALQLDYALSNVAGRCTGRPLPVYYVTEHWLRRFTPALDFPSRQSWLEGLSPSVGI